MDGIAWQNLWFVFCLSGGCLSEVTPTTYGSRHSAVSLDLNTTFNPPQTTCLPSLRGDTEIGAVFPQEPEAARARILYSPFAISLSSQRCGPVKAVISHSPH